MAEPCWKCGVRADIGCIHQAADGSKPIAIVEDLDADKRTKRTDQGLAYKFKRGNLNSIFGKGGNPTMKEFKKMLKK